VNYILGLVDPRLRPLVGALMLVGFLYALSRAARYLSLRQARQTLRDDDFTGHGVHRSVRTPDSGPHAIIVTPSSAYPVPRQSSATGTVFLIAGAAALAAAVGLTLMRSRSATTASAAMVDSISVDAGSLAMAAPDTAFRFEDAGWTMERDVCVATIRITAISRRPRRLTLHVSDASGNSIGNAVLDSPVVSPGAMVRFQFPRIDCKVVDQWEVRGEFPKN